MGGFGPCKKRPPVGCPQATSRRPRCEFSRPFLQNEKKGLKILNVYRHREVLMRHEYFPLQYADVDLPGPVSIKSLATRVAITGRKISADALLYDTSDLIQKFGWLIRVYAVRNEPYAQMMRISTWPRMRSDAGKNRRSSCVGKRLPKIESQAD